MKNLQILYLKNQKNIIVNTLKNFTFTSTRISNNDYVNIDNINNNKKIFSANKNINFLNFQKHYFAKRSFEQSRFNELTEKHKGEVKILTKANQVEEEKEETQNKEKSEISTRISTNLLCTIIGCKNYPTNDEINLDEDVLVNVYDETDKFLGKQSFGEAYKYALEIGKDIILRNDKVVPPIMKVMKYKVELVKKVLKKLGKTVESEKKETYKYFTLSMNISENDFNNKKEKIKELLAHFSYLRLIIPCDINNPEATLKSTSLLNTLSNDLSDFCKVKAGPIRQKQKKQKVDYVDAKLTDSMAKHEKQEKEIKEAYEISQIKDVNSEKDLDFINSVYIDYESLLLDSTGINYEKLLQNIDLESLIKGVAKSNIITKVKKIKKFFKIK